MTTPPDWITLRIFVAAVELGSVARAAGRCNIATSAAGKRLQDLEAGAGTPLLERSPRGVRPTAAGEAFARHARVLLDLAGRLGDDLKAFAGGGVGSVRLHATTSAIAGHRLAEALAGFARERPHIRVELAELTSLTILQDLLERRADLGIVTSAGALPAGLVAHPWHEDRLLVLLPAAHAFAGRPALRFAEVLEEPMIAVLRGGALALLIERQAELLGRAPRYRFSVASTDAARRLVAAGHGLTIMPDGVARPCLAALGLAAVPLDEPWARRRLSLVAREEEAVPSPAHLLLGWLRRVPEG